MDELESYGISPRGWTCEQKLSTDEQKFHATFQVFKRSHHKISMQNFKNFPINFENYKKTCKVMLSILNFQLFNIFSMFNWFPLCFASTPFGGCNNIWDQNILKKGFFFLFTVCKGLLLENQSQVSSALIICSNNYLFIAVEYRTVNMLTDLSIQQCYHKSSTMLS